MNTITLEQMDSIQEFIAEQERERRKKEERRKNFLYMLKFVLRHTNKRA